MGRKTTAAPAPGKPLSIKDIAAISGVSIATVSRVLNGKGGYSPETETRVRAVTDSCGYVSNMAARTLRAAHSQTVGLILPNVGNTFYAQLAYKIETYLSGFGYSVFICNSDTNVEKERAYFRSLAGKRVDGILCVSGLAELTQDILFPDIPVVCVDRRPKAPERVPYVANDDRAAGALATAHLLDKGCRHILFVSSFLAGYGQRERAAGFRQALAARGLPVDKNYILERPGRDPTPIEAEVLVYDFLRQGHPVDGIVTASESAALGSLYALGRAGLRVPEDVRVIGFDNTLFSLLTNPPLSSVERNSTLLAHRACEVLLTLIAGGTPPRVTEIPVELVERGSTA